MMHLDNPSYVCYSIYVTQDPQEAKINIFFVHNDPFIAAQSLVDRHVVKMILESAQLLSTAHRILDGVPYAAKSASGRQVKRWRLDDDRESVLYSATHVNHPSAVWCRESSGHYHWLYWHFVGLIDEYYHRYGKVHKCDSMKQFLVDIPNNIKHLVFKQPPPAMDKSYIISEDSVANYRNYYSQGKSHLHKYTNRNAPEWL
jgi:hypothetical protein